MSRRNLRLNVAIPPPTRKPYPPKRPVPRFTRRKHNETFKCENGHLYSGLAIADRAAIFMETGNLRDMENNCPHCALALYYEDYAAYERELAKYKWITDKDKIKVAPVTRKIRVKTTS